MRKEKLFRSLLIVAIIAILTPIVMYATTTETSNNFILRKTLDGINVIGYEGTDEEITIPSEYEDSQVKKVTIDGDETITSIIIPDGVEEVVLTNLPLVTNIQLPSSVKTLELVQLDTLGNINIPEGVQTLKIQNCATLKEVIMPDSLTQYEAFTGCTGLEKVKFGTGITEIVSESFYGCTLLKDVEFSNTIKIIDRQAFYSCEGLTAIEIPDSVEIIERNAFHDCTGLESVKIGTGIKEIKSRAFYYCPILTNVEIPDNTIETIPREAFGYAALSYIKIPEGVKTIEYKAFFHCQRLVEVDFPETLETIESDAFCFYNAYSDKGPLKTVTIPRNVTSMGGAFSNYSGECCVDTMYGYVGTYAESYANEYGIEFRPLDGVWVEEDIPDYHYVLTILGPNKEKTTRVAASINGTAYRGNSGVVTFNKDMYAVGDEIDIVVTYEGKDYHLKHVIQEIGIGFIKIPSSDYELTAAYVNGHETISTGKIVNLGATDTLTFDLAITNSTDELYFQICQGEEVLGVKLGKSNVTMNIDSSRIKEKEKLYVNICDKDLNVLYTQQLNITFLDHYVFKNGGKFEISDEVKLEFPNDFSFLAGTEVKIPFVLQKIFPIEAEYSDEKIKIGITTVDDVEFDPESYEKCIEELLNPKDDIYAGDESNMSLDFALYKEMSFDKGVWVDNKNFGALKLTYKDSHWGTVAVYSIPVTFELKTTLEGAVEAGINYNFDEDKFEIMGNIEVGGKFRTEAGIGVKEISAGIFAELEAKLKFYLLPEFKFNEFEISGSAGLYGEFVGAGADIPVIAPDVKYTLNEDYEWKKESILSPESLYDLNSYNKTTRNLSLISMAWLEEHDLVDETKKLLANDIYTFTNQKIISNGTDTMLLFIDNEVLRDEYNFKTLKYSIYDSQNDSWGIPEQLDINETQDNSFVAYTDGTDIYVIYTEEKLLLDENSKLEDYVKNQEISVAKWDTEAKEFNNISTLTNNETYDSIPTISIINNVPTAIWVNNASNSPFGITTDNSIVYSKFENEVWTTPQTLVANRNAIIDLNVGNIGDTSYIAIVEDLDNDLTTIEDRKLAIIDFNGNEKEISTASNGNIEFIKYKDNNIFTWYENGVIKALNDINGETYILYSNEDNNIPTDYIFVLDGENLRIIYTTSSDNGYAIYQIIEENGIFGEPVKVVETSNLISFYDAIMQNDKLLVNYTDTQINVVGEEIQKTSNLYGMLVADEFDLELVDVQYDEENYTSGQASDIYVYIKNTAEIKADNINIKITNENQKELYNKTFAKEILPGKIECIELTDVILPKCTTWNITISETQQTENITDNNTQSINMILSKLDVTAYQIFEAKADYALVKIENNGDFDAENVTLNVLQGETIVETQVVEKIAANSISTVWVYLKDEYFQEGRTEGLLNFCVTTDTQDLYTSNNSYRLAILDLSEPEYRKGDINKDGLVDSADAAIALNLYKYNNATEGDLELGDMDENGMIDSADAAIILNIFKYNL